MLVLLRAVDGKHQGERYGGLDRVCPNRQDPCGGCGATSVVVERPGLAYANPLSHAVLRALELEEYRSAGHRDAELLTRKLGISRVELDQSLDILLASRQVRRSRRGYRLDRVLSVDTGADPRRARALRLVWTRTAVRRLEQGVPATFGYSLFAVSAADLQRLREIQRAYIREMQSVIAQSTPAECVGLYCFQLLDLADKPSENGAAAPVEPPTFRAT